MIEGKIQPMKYLVAVFLLVTAGVVVGIGVSAGHPTISAGMASQQTFVLQLDWLLDLIERIDRILEEVVDLVNTIRELFGGEGGG